MRHTALGMFLLVSFSWFAAGNSWSQKPPERLDAYAAQPWPRWTVEPGFLTPRGFELIKRLGVYDRLALANLGLLSASGCDDAARTYIWADTDQRTIATGRALAESLFPGCPQIQSLLHGLPEGQTDPLFHPTASVVKPASADAAYADFAAKVKQQHDPEQAALLDQLQHVLLGCAPAVACTPAQPPKNRILGDPTAPVRGKGDHIVDLQGPLALASTFSEDLLLEYADGMPDVGWGHVDQAQLRRFLGLHSDYFDLLHRTPALARIEASNLLFHIARTLQQAVEAKPVPGAIGPADAKLVLLAGHDTNLAGLAELLGIHWNLDGRADDTPPGTQLAFELWQTSAGGYSVRLTVAMQTLQQLRDDTPLTLASPPAHQVLSLPACPANCSWDAFHKLAETALDPSDVLPEEPERP